MNLTVFFISFYIFCTTLGYGVYEFKNYNKLGGIMVIILTLFMIIFVNYVTIHFN